VAWLPLLAIYVLVFLTDMSIWMALSAGLANVLPLALLGLGIIALTRRIPLGEHRLGFFAIQLGIGLAYAGLALGGQYLSFRLIAGVRDGVWTLAADAIDPRIYAWQIFTALVIYSAMTSISYAAQLVGRAERARALQAEAELKTLRAKLNPHFLFNTLHSVLALVRQDPEAAEEALERFGDLLHYSLRAQQDAEEVPLADEHKFVQDYLALEKLRLDTRLRISIEIGQEAMDCLVPVFCLQPLVENAIRHAIAPRAEGGRLEIRGAIADGRLSLSVADDGPGQRNDTSNGSGLGLRLVRERLKSLYAERATFDVSTSPGNGFTATLSLPVRRT